MIHGILPVDKPEHISSAQVVARVKRAFGAKKAGHTGTLDPFATGLMLIALGKACRISKFFLEGNKSYLAQVALGFETDTYDKTGTPTRTADPDTLSRITPDMVKQVLEEFKGPQDQVPPSFSALKHKGQPLYKLARQGTMIEKPPRKIHIFDIGIESMDLPVFSFYVHCSSGTYIRRLAQDMGQRLGCPAHLSGLVRTGSSGFGLEKALSLDTIEKEEKASLEQSVIPMAKALSFMRGFRADRSIIQKIRHGQALTCQDIPADQIDTSDRPDKGGDFIRVLDEAGDLAAVIFPDETGLTYNYSCVFAE